MYDHYNRSITRQEIKGNLARLLATENLIVEHRGDIPTASFDVDRRVLQLPQWDKASGQVYDMLVGHEVGHALYTPNEDYTDYVQCPMDYVNVVEDVRIEKLMKRKYPGLRKSFNAGYKELGEQDFFQVEGIDYNTILFIDRINLHYKLGPSAMIPFSEEEKVFVNRVADTETFEEVCALAGEIYGKAKADQPTDQQPNSTMPMPSGEDQGDGDGELEQQYKTPNSDSDSKEGEDNDLEDLSEGKTPKGDKSEGEMDAGSQQPSGGAGSNGAAGAQGSQGFQDIESSQTQQSFDSAAKNLSTESTHNIGYFEIPSDIKLDDYLVDWTDVHEWIDERFDAQEPPRVSMADDGTVYWRQQGIDDADQQYREYRSQAQKEVNYLVKEFECRKSASAYARATTSKTGVIDTTKLHTYMYNEDIFKKVSVVPDGKNHGLLFLLDWSGSMSDQLHATFKQVLNLTAFCKKVNIPFEVYAFTNEWKVVQMIKDNNPEARSYWHHDDPATNQPVVGELHIRKGEFNLLNIVSSRSNSRDYERQCKNIFRCTYAHEFRGQCYQIPEGMQLSGTPLNEAIVMLNYIIPSFRKKNDLEKVNVCVLTDGEGSRSGYGRISKRDYEEEDKIYVSAIGTMNALRDRKTGIVYKPLADCYCGLTNQLLVQVRDRNPGVNILGFRILSGSRLSDFVNRYSDNHYSYDRIQSQWRKDKSAVIPNPLGYTALYAIQQTALDADTEMSVESGAKKADISRAFKKMLKSKSTNKKLLNSFVGYVA